MAPQSRHSAAGRRRAAAGSSSSSSPPSPSSTSASATHAAPSSPPSSPGFVVTSSQTRIKRPASTASGSSQPHESAAKRQRTGAAPSVTTKTTTLDDSEAPSSADPDSEVVSNPDLLDRVPRPRSIRGLPNELLEKILDYLSRHDLGSCTRVCKRLQPLAEERLFSLVVIVVHLTVLEGKEYLEDHLSVHPKRLVDGIERFPRVAELAQKHPPGIHLVASRVRRDRPGGLMAGIHPSRKRDAITSLTLFIGRLQPSYLAVTLVDSPIPPTFTLLVGAVRASRVTAFHIEDREGHLHPVFFQKVIHRIIRSCAPCLVTLRMIDICPFAMSDYSIDGKPRQGRRISPPKLPKLENFAYQPPPLTAASAAREKHYLERLIMQAPRLSYLETPGFQTGFGPSAWGDDVSVAAQGACPPCAVLERVLAAQTALEVAHNQNYRERGSELRKLYVGQLKIAQVDGEQTAVSRALDLRPASFVTRLIVGVVGTAVLHRLPPQLVALQIVDFGFCAYDPANDDAVAIASGIQFAGLYQLAELFRSRPLWQPRLRELMLRRPRRDLMRLAPYAHKITAAFDTIVYECKQRGIALVIEDAYMDDSE